MSNVQVSVIIPTYNSSNTIIRALDSILNQSVLPFEVIIIDDSSNDETNVLIEDYKNKNDQKLPIKILTNEKNSGPAFSRNKGIVEAKGDWVAFLDADDFWHPQKIKIQIFCIEKYGTNFIGTTTSLFNSPIKSYDLENISIRRLSASDFLWKNYFQTPTVLIKKDEILRFNPTMFYSEDFELWFKMISLYKSGILVNEPLAFLGKRPYIQGGLSSHLIRMELGEISVLWQEKNIFLRFLAIMFSVAKFFRRCLIRLISKKT